LPALGRREFLRRGARLGAAAVVAGRGASGLVDAAAAATRPRALRRPGSLPHPHLPAGTDTLPQIEHVIVLMMENHSFDNYLGVLGRGDGLPLDRRGRPTATNRDANGEPVRAFRMPSTCQVRGAPSQNWNASHLAYGGGRNEGFVRASGPVAMGYWTPEDLPFYASLARTFVLCDRWFASVPAATYPNRRYLVAATSQGHVTNSGPDAVLGPSPPNGLVFDLLDAHGITWKDYFTTLPTAGLFRSAATRPRHLVRVDEFFADAAAGTLPGFAIVDPDFANASEEDPQDVHVGEQFAERVIRAVLDGPAWPRSMLIWCYDEHGGYYDHVPPPRAVPPDAIAPFIHVPPDQPGAFDRYGFRVPAVVVSPYARRHHVSHVVHDHTSILKLVETKWNLPALTYRDANADPLLDCLDLRGRPNFAEPPALHPSALASGAARCTPGQPGPIPDGAVPTVPGPTAGG
jgi:phospholipase C